MSEQPVLVTGIRPGLDIRAEEYGENPVADWLCTCGQHERARGTDDVRDLAARARVGHCPHNDEGAVLATVVPIRRITREAS